jgi:hypothetical protein
MSTCWNGSEKGRLTTLIGRSGGTELTAESALGPPPGFVSFNVFAGGSGRLTLGFIKEGI